MCPPEATYGSWQIEHFTAAELADATLEASLWGKSANPDGDCCENLLEYALGTDPRNATPSPITQSADDGKLSIEFPAPRANIDYSVNWSFDLESWYDNNITIQNLEGTWIRASTPIDADSKFLSLSVTLQP